MKGPREKANAEIASLNPKMTDEFLAYSLSAMKENALISGRNQIDETGLIRESRIQDQINTLSEIGLLDKEMTVDEVAPLTFLPTRFDASFQK